MTAHDLTQFSEYLAAAYFIVKGILSWLADATILVLKHLDPSHKEDDD